ncbi:SHC SH2 domain-binding protein 1 [Orchesella cincta]|uniref:SHC SH2 domain-binding protein 1 n=1 Tax=Orchesella cincta TaxID=48709 RepID=A0A1D2N4Y5_ORCCI|nr:SHC SH2 domain-binding protein 1 [Orchesella cincta]
MSGEAKSLSLEVESCSEVAVDQEKLKEGGGGVPDEHTSEEETSKTVVEIAAEVNKLAIEVCAGQHVETDLTEEEDDKSGYEFIMDERESGETSFLIEDDEDKDQGEYEEDFRSNACSTVFSESEYEESEPGNMVEYSFFDFSPWDLDANANTYQLWHVDEQFRNNGTKYKSAVMTYGNDCIDTCYRAHSRKPTVKEFWNYYISKTVPLESWYAVWMVVNPERRGWPMQYIKKAKVLVKSILFRSPLATPKTEIEVVESYDERFTVGQSLEIALWQLEPCEAGPEFFDDGITIEEGKGALGYARKFFEQYYFPCDNGDFVAFFENCFYDRLELIHYLEHAAPNQGTLSNKDRVKIISGIKHYHYLSNVLQDLNNEHDDDNDEDEDAVQRQELDSKYLTLQMQLDRLKVELRFLLNKTMRALMGAISDRGIGADDDSSVSNYDYVLVMKTMKSNDLLKLHELLNSHLSDNVDANIRIMNDLESALRKCNVYSTLFVASGEYAISGLGRLGGGGAIIGIPLNDVDVTITPTDEVGDIWISVATDASETPLKLVNLNFVIDEDCEKTLDSCIHLSTGTLNMKDCSVRLPQRLCGTEDQGSCTKLRAVRVSDGANFIQEGCKIDNSADVD